CIRAHEALAPDVVAVRSAHARTSLDLSGDCRRDLRLEERVPAVACMACGAAALRRVLESARLSLRLRSDRTRDSRRRLLSQRAADRLLTHREHRYGARRAASTARRGGSACGNLDRRETGGAHSSARARGRGGVAAARVRLAG